MTHMVHYKRVSLIGLALSILSLAPLAIWPASMPTWIVLLLLLIIGAGLGTVFPVSTVCMQNAVSRSQMGLPRVRPIFSLAVFGAGRCAAGCNRACGLGGAAGMSIEMLARTASAPELAYAFRFASRLRLGAFLRDGLLDCDGGASAQRPIGSLTGGQRTDGSRNADSKPSEAIS